MKNIYKDTFNEIFELRDSLSEESKPFDYKNFIIQNGKAIYVYEGFNFDALTSAVKLYLFNELNQVTDSIKITESITQISYFTEQGIADKLNITEKFKILLYLNRNVFLHPGG